MSLIGQYYLGVVSRDSTARKQEISALIDSSLQFQVFAAAFATEMFQDKTVSAATRSRLIENLNNQFAQARNVQGIVPQDMQSDLENYRRKTLHMIDVANRTNDVMAMKDFYSAASNLTVAKNKLNSGLKTAA